MTSPAWPSLLADRVAYRYPQNNPGPAPLSPAVGSGERLLSSGPSGCCKSTLVRILTGLIPHLHHGTLEGTVWLDGLSTRDAPLWQLVERAGYIVFGALGGLLGALTLAALRRAGAFAYLAEQR